MLYLLIFLLGDHIIYVDPSMYTYTVSQYFASFMQQLEESA